MNEADAELAAGGPSINWERLDRALHKAYGDAERNKRLRETAKWSEAQDKARRAKEREEKRRRAAAARQQAQQARAIAARRWRDEGGCWRFDDGDQTLWVVYLRAEGQELVVYINSVTDPSVWIEVDRQSGFVAWNAYTDAYGTRAYILPAGVSPPSRAAGGYAWTVSSDIRPWSFGPSGAYHRPIFWYISWQDRTSTGVQPWICTTPQFYSGWALSNGVHNTGSSSIPTRYFRLTDDYTAIERWAPTRNGAPYEPTVGLIDPFRSSFGISGLILCYALDFSGGDGQIGNDAAYDWFVAGIPPDGQAKSGGWHSYMGQRLHVRYYLNGWHGRNSPELREQMLAIVGRPNAKGYAQRWVPNGHPNWNWSSGEFSAIGLAFM
jgi:hypothetical protein